MLALLSEKSKDQGISPAVKALPLRGGLCPGVYGFNCAPSRNCMSHVKVLSSSTSSCDLVWIEDLGECNWISETSLGEAEPFDPV